MEVISKIFTKDKAPFLEGITASNNLFGWIQGNGGQLTNDLREKTNKKYIFFDFTKNFIINSFFNTKIKCKYLSTGERMNMIVQKFDLLFIRIGALTVNLGADFDRLLNQIHFNFSL